MNAKIDLVTFDYIKKKFHIKKKKYFGLLTLFFVAIAIEVSWWQNNQTVVLSMSMANTDSILILQCNFSTLKEIFIPEQSSLKLFVWNF